MVLENQKAIIEAMVTIKEHNNLRRIPLIPLLNKIKFQLQASNHRVQ